MKGAIMNRIFSSWLAVVASATLAASSVAQGRHDDKPHGVDAKAAAGKPSPSEPTKYVTLPSGPRAHDNPLRGRKIAVTPKPERPAEPNAPAK
jgi:hypothetical protein